MFTSPKPRSTNLEGLAAYFTSKCLQPTSSQEAYWNHLKNVCAQEWKFRQDPAGYSYNEWSTQVMNDIFMAVVRLNKWDFYEEAARNFAMESSPNFVKTLIGHVLQSDVFEEAKAG